MHGDVRPDSGAHRQHQRKRRQAFPKLRPKMARGLVKVGRQDAHARVSPSPKLQIHQQKRQIVLNIEITQKVTELDAVEDDQLAVLQQNIGQVQVTMAATRKARTRAARQERPLARSSASVRAIKASTRSAPRSGLNASSNPAFELTVHSSDRIPPAGRKGAAA